MATQQELAAQLNALTPQLTKINGEIDGLQGVVDTLTVRVAELEAQLAGAPVSPELQAAFDAVKAAVQSVDENIPDQVVLPE